MVIAAPSEFARQSKEILKRPRLQDLVLHLSDAKTYPFDLGTQLVEMDPTTYNYTLTLLWSFRMKGGPKDQAFLDLVEQLTELRKQST